jgi:hypothetical protein
LAYCCSFGAEGASRFQLRHASGRRRHFTSARVRVEQVALRGRAAATGAHAARGRRPGARRFPEAAPESPVAVVKRERPAVDRAAQDDGIRIAFEPRVADESLQ